MLSVMEAIQQRRSIRRFRKKPVSRDMIFQMLEAARLAPSGSNRQPWRFIVVTDDEEKKILRHICLDQAFIEEAGVVFIACADLSSYSKEAAQKRYQEAIDAGVDFAGKFADTDFRRKMIDETPPPDLMTAGLPAVSNTFIAVEHLVLAATALGLGSCWVGAIQYRDTIKAMYELPDNIMVAAVVPVGYTESVPPPRPRLPLEDLLLRPVPDSD